MGVRFPFMMVFAFIMAFRINSYLATILAGAMILTTVFMVIILTKARPLFLKMQSRVDRVNAIIQENLTGIRVVKSFNRQKHEEERFKKLDELIRDVQKSRQEAAATIPSKSKKKKKRGLFGKS